jgi:hypothetical protein
MWFLFGEGGWGISLFFCDRPTKWSIAKKKTHKNICGLGCTIINLID